MNNPFADLKTIEEHGDTEERKLLEEQKTEKREAFYNLYTPMVEEVLDMLIAATQPGVWKKGSDCTHRYCCHINWFVGPQELYKAAYDEKHEIRRRVEVALEQDAFCNPTGFRIINHQSINKSVHVGLSKDELIRGVRAVLVPSAGEAS
jgi:hypothetical protein